MDIVLDEACAAQSFYAADARSNAHSPQVRHRIP